MGRRPRPLSGKRPIHHFNARADRPPRGQTRGVTPELIRGLADSAMLLFQGARHAIEMTRVAGSADTDGPIATAACGVRLSDPIRPRGRTRESGRRVDLFVGSWLGVMASVT